MIEVSNVKKKRLKGTKEEDNLSVDALTKRPATSTTGVECGGSNAESKGKRHQTTGKIVTEAEGLRASTSSDRKAQKVPKKRHKVESESESEDDEARGAGNGDEHTIGRDTKKRRKETGAATIDEAVVQKPRTQNRASKTSKRKVVSDPDKGCVGQTAFHPVPVRGGRLLID